MARGNCTFKQTDVTRALRATVAAGIEVQRIEIENGKIVVVVAKNENSDQSTGGNNPWDDALK